MLTKKPPVQPADNFRSAFADSNGAIAHQPQYSPLSSPTHNSGHQRLSSALPDQRPVSGQVMSLREATTNLSNRSGSSRWQSQGWLGQQAEGIRKRLSQASSSAADSPNKGPLVGIIDTGFRQGQHGLEVLKTIQSANTDSQIVVADGVGKGGWAKSLTQFVDVAKASGEMRAVANLSFDLSQKNPDGSVATRHQLTAAESKALDYAKQNNVLVVASAGNEGSEMSALGAASGRSDNLIVVGTAQGNDRAAYSSFGPGLDFLVSADSQRKAGTSMAAAETTRTIAQLWANNPQLTSSQIVQVLEVTAQDLKMPGWDLQTGMGLLNPAAAGLAANTLLAQPALAELGLLKTSQSSGSNREIWTGGEGAIASERPNRRTRDRSRPPSRGMSTARALNEHQAYQSRGASSGSSRASLAESRRANIDAANARARDRTNAQRDAAMANRARSEQQARAQQPGSQTLKYVPGTSTMSSDRVRQWQNAMKAQGFDIAVDGRYGPQSAAVAREFQRRNGLAADGRVGPQTWAASFRQPANPRQADAQAGWTKASNTTTTQANAQATLKYTPGTSAMSSDRVKQWQTAMKAQGFDIAVDGLYGPQSAAVAREFQRRNGLAADGRVGPQTWAASFRQPANPRQADAQAGVTEATRPPAPPTLPSTRPPVPQPLIRRRAGNRAGTPRTYITYTLRDASGDIRYVGRASGIGTPQHVMDNRLDHPVFGQHHILARHPGLNLTAHIEGVQSNLRSNKGAEEVLYTRNQRYVANKTLRAPGTGVRISGGVNQGGQQLLNRLTPTSNKTGNPLVEAYVNDSGAWDRTAYESQARQMNASTTGASGANGRVARGVVRGVSRYAAPVGIAIDGYSLYDAYRQDGGFGENFGSTAGGVAGGWGGAAAGAVVGAAIGSIVPGVGTVIGGAVGGILGGFGGSLAGEEIVEQMQDRPA